MVCVLETPRKTISGHSPRMAEEDRNVESMLLLVEIYGTDRCDMTLLATTRFKREYKNGAHGWLFSQSLRYRVLSVLYQFRCSIHPM